MKKHYPAAAVGIGLVILVAGIGRPISQAQPDTVPTVVEVQPALSPDKDKDKETEKSDEAKPKDGSPADSEKRQEKALNPQLEAQVNAPPATNETAVTPETIQPSPALAEVIRLLQGGVSEEVVLAYITNSAEPFSIGADEVLFLHDLGAPPHLITTLIQKDSSPEMVALKKSANAVKPLPPGVALTAPATNIFATSPPSSTPPEPVAVHPPSGIAPPAATAPVAYTPPEVIEEPSYFYDELAPYGTWVDVSGYGRCWRPTVAVWNSGWRPYADGGRWLWTDCGWYWYSDYSWGWAPFHYGRWTCPTGVGWVWVPGTCWGPAWVSWRYSSSYCGWAPLPPSAHFVVGHGFYCNSVSVGFGFEFGLGCSDYIFVSSGNLCDRHPRHLTATHATTIYKDTTVVNNYGTINKNTVVNNGAGFDRIQRATRGNIRQVALKGTSDVRVTNTRREVLDADGKTLTVAQPAKVAPGTAAAVTGTSTAAGSGIRPRTDRHVATAPNPKETSTSPTSGFADTANSTRRADFSGTAAGGSVPRTGFVPRSAGAQSQTTASTAGTVAKPDTSKTTPSSPNATVHEPKNPFAPVTVRGVTPRSARNEQPMVSDSSGSRPAATPNVSQPAPIRPPTAHAPAPNQFQQYQPRPRATIPSAPAPSSSGTFAPPSRVAPASPRAESHHVPASPAPQAAPRAERSAPASAPAPAPRASSSSGGGNGGGSGGGGSGGGGSGGGNSHGGGNSGGNSGGSGRR